MTKDEYPFIDRTMKLHDQATVYWGLLLSFSGVSTGWIAAFGDEIGQNYVFLIYVIVMEALILRGVFKIYHFLRLSIDYSSERVKELEIEGEFYNQYSNVRVASNYELWGIAFLVMFFSVTVFLYATG